MGVNTFKFKTESRYLLPYNGEKTWEHVSHHASKLLRHCNLHDGAGGVPWDDVEAIMRAGTNAADMNGFDMHFFVRGMALGSVTARCCSCSASVAHASHAFEDQMSLGDRLCPLFVRASQGHSGPAQDYCTLCTAITLENETTAVGCDVSEAFVINHEHDMVCGGLSMGRSSDNYFSLADHPTSPGPSKDADTQRVELEPYPYRQGGPQQVDSSIVLDFVK